MISLCGSPPEGFFQFIGVSLVLTVGFLSFTHYKVYKTDYYNEEYVYFSAGKKVLLYLLFLAINLCVLPLLLLIAIFLYKEILK